MAERDDGRATRLSIVEETGEERRRCLWYLYLQQSGDQLPHRRLRRRRQPNVPSLVRLPPPSAALYMSEGIMGRGSRACACS